MRKRSGLIVEGVGSVTAPLLTVENLSKRFGAVQAVDDVSFEIDAGAFFALLGPSGCGKTTIMRMIAGFEEPDTGRILIDGEDVVAHPPHKRPVNMMFQSYALFPHMSVAKNIAFPLRRQGKASGVVAERVRDMLRLVQLEGLGERRPHQLSGGQKARVALARALAARPRLLLLDEPLSALDRKMREETQFELMQVQRDLGVAFLVVTHDQNEAMAMAQRIAVMRQGRIEQIGAARDVYEHPASAWLASFIGDANLIDAMVSGEAETADAGALHLLCDASGITLQADASHVFGDRPAIGARVKIAVRAERVLLTRIKPDAINVLQGEIVEAAYLGDMTVLRVACVNGVAMRVARLNAVGDAFARGEFAYVSWPVDAARILTR